MPDVDLELTVEDALRARAREQRLLRPRRPMTFVLFCGVALPLAAISVELLLRLCSFAIDPIPTLWHLAALALVPAANLFAYYVYRRPDLRQARLATFLVGASIGIAAVYSVQFIPMLPASIFGIVVFGLGLLGLSPFLALAASIVCAGRLGELRPARRPLWAGIALTALLLGWYIVSGHITVAGLRMATSNDEQTSLRGVRLIRTFGSRSALLRLCYDQPVGIWLGTFWTSFDANRPTREQARDVYYRVTGRSFNSVAPPVILGSRSLLSRQLDFDSDVGGTAVNGRVTSLALTSSNMDAVVYPDQLTAYTEWTVLFTNSAQIEREARAEIALPHGAVVSRLTLWINGEPREAAFSTRGNVRGAYQEVAVQQRRDPVLVTTCGPDRVLLQCFPVPPRGGKMKVRLGITSPLTPDGLSKAIFTLPHFIERNFGSSEGLTHSLIVNSRRLRLTDGELPGPRGRMVFPRSAGVRSVWTPDMLEPGRYAVVETVAESRVSAPENVVIVVDGSARIGKVRDQIASALSALPTSCRFTLIEAGDEVMRLTSMRAASPDAIQKAQGALRSARWVGGIDNRPALLAASDIAARRPRSLILWIHGPQPLTSDARAEQLVQLSRRRPGSMTIVAVDAADGQNSILADLDETGAVTVLPRRGTLQADLQSLLAGWRDGARVVAVTRTRVPLTQATGERGSSHIARLWARDEAARMCARDARLAADASQLAARHQIVTPVSGAVVLETKEQYDRHGLKPVSPRSAPSTIPEPAGWVGLAGGAAILLASSRRRKEMRSRGSK